MTATTGTATRAGPSLLAAVVLLVSLATVATAALVGALIAALAWLCLRHPFGSALVALSAAAYVAGGVPAAAVPPTLAAACALAWRAGDRESFDRWVLCRWRRSLVYGWRWRRAMTACGLHRDGRLVARVPRLGTVRSTWWADDVSVRLLPGQSAADVAVRAEQLARELGAWGCTVRPGVAGTVGVLLRRDRPPARPFARPAARTSAVGTTPAGPDIDALWIGQCEDGTPWTVSLAGDHLLVVRGAGSAQGPVLWPVLRALAPAVRGGAVELWGVDGTGGLGLGRAEPMFARLAMDRPADGLAVVDAATDLLRRRAARAGTRAWAEIGGTEPHVVLVLHDVGVWGPELFPPERERLAVAIDLLLGYGGTAGVAVIVITWDADAALATRFAQRVTLQPAGSAGALAGSRGLWTSHGERAVRVRPFPVDDDEIATMLTRLSAPRPDVALLV